MHPPTDLQDVEAALEAEGDEGALHARLLLWYMRKVMQVRTTTSIEYVFDADAGGLDGFWVEPAPEDQFPTLHIFECKTGTGPGDDQAIAALERFRDTVANFDKLGFETDHVARGSQGGTCPRTTRCPAIETLRAASDSPPSLQRLKATASTCAGARRTGLRPHIAARLARALRGPGLLVADQLVHCPADRRFVSETGAGLIVVCEVQAEELAAWPGIEDRTLFGLNVRGELRQNRVRTGLDTAIDTPADHPNFIAYHNGLTVLCHGFDATHPDHIRITDLSVVNGAQSLLAFHRHRVALTGSDLRVLVKFVTYPADEPGFATRGGASEQHADCSQP